MAMISKSEHKRIAIAVMTLALAACGGDNGDDGPAGAQGATGEQGPPGQSGAPGSDGQNGQDLTAQALSRRDLLSNVNNAFYVNDEGRISEMSAGDLREIRGSAKNVILFVGDGMGPSTVTASRVRDGELKGMSWDENTSRDFAGPESNDLSFDRFPFVGLVKTYNTNSQVPDSAGTMGAMVTGVKTDIGVFGFDETVVRGDCTTGSKNNELVTSLELAEIAGMSTGIVTTARVTHATPGANYAKSVDRNFEDNSDIPATSNCFGVQEDIASQLISFEARIDGMGYEVDGVDVVMGGGRRHFIPRDVAFNVEKPASAGAEGDRTDGRDLPSEWQAQYPQGVYVTDRAGFNAINPGQASKVLGLFNESHMQYELDRGNDIAGEPSLTEMTAKAIQILDNNPSGFFLQVESGRIDHAHHAGNAAGALADTIEFAKAVQAAVNLTSAEDTLILVTADHSHVFTIGGYVKRGNPILGKAIYSGSDTEQLASDGLPFTTLAYTNGRGFCDLGSETDSDAGYDCPIVSGRVDISSIDTEATGFHQEALIPMTSETHAGEDVALYASGPAASLVRGTSEQNLVFHVTDYALDLIARANAAAN